MLLLKQNIFHKISMTVKNKIGSMGIEYLGSLHITKACPIEISEIIIYESIKKVSSNLFQDFINSLTFLKNIHINGKARKKISNKKI